VGLQATHEANDSGAVTLAYLFTGIETQANVVVAPDAHSLNLPKQVHRLLDPLTRLEHIAQDHEAFGPMLLEQGNGLLQVPCVLVNVGQ